MRNTNTDKGPAIDAGNTTLTVDQRGFSREVDIFNAPDPPDSDNINDDIGAFEAQANPTAASVTISGRDMMSPFGKGIARAQVSITDANGQTRATRTNFFGYYRFESVDAGETYIFNISSTFYSFSPQVITINEELADLNFIAEP